MNGMIKMKIGKKIQTIKIEINAATTKNSNQNTHKFSIHE